MFTGIIEAVGMVQDVQKNRNNIELTIQSDLAHEFHIDQSISHNGICLTVDKLFENAYRVTAIDETLQKTNLSNWKIGDKVNLERCVRLNDRLDGHIVQGHIDQTGTVTSIKNENGSKLLNIEYDKNSGNVTVEKGSIALNGVSLTVLNSTDSSFSVAIIPYTWEYTSLSSLQVGDRVNLEFDILGKYIKKLMSR